ncbi:hypothetical protein NP233_g5470 [Leucocoprinus birnbaumii]|uniref:Uncharacterized protein n=1 Tax=Leucocoprinus birnbaumii TaxID=56174 RepID=A0AAD5YWQ0_9AGAR|nr:hypothetical protein NP233_g5470 [Leucocoprinus birnbaumii]
MSDDAPSTEPQRSGTLNYNVRWMTNSFSNRSKVESLLGPEHSAGNISRHDYDAAINFLPGFHRFYALFLSSAAMSAVYILKKPSWSRLRTLGVAGGIGIGSIAVGNGLTLKSHLDFVRSLDNPGGFSRALDRIQKQSNLALPSSPVIVHRYKIEEELHGNTVDHQEFVQPEITAEPVTQSTIQTPSASSETRPKSQWDQIRAANAAKTTSSSWDALRQRHEKPRVQNSGTCTGQATNDQQVDDRAAEQAKFDALLEKERNLSSQDLRE